jgi:protein-disulfide isomerase
MCRAPAPAGDLRIGRLAKSSAGPYHMPDMKLTGELPIESRTAHGVAMARLLAALVLMLGVQAGAARTAAAAPPLSAQDAQLIGYLQKHFRIPASDAIALSPAKPAPIAGLLSRTMILSGPGGQTASAELFMDPSGRHVIVGTLLQTDQDPWGRTDLKGIHLEDRPSVGPANAPVTVSEFGDFECPFCARALNIVETLVNTTYKGRVRLIFKNFPLAGHLWANTAATASECARLQNPDAFWAFARGFYHDQAAIDPKNIRQHIDQYASALQLDNKVLSACMLSRAPSDRIAQDMADGAALKVASTPTFYVNGIPVVGFPDEKSLSFVIDSELRNPQTAAAKP